MMLEAPPSAHTTQGEQPAVRAAAAAAAAAGGLQHTFGWSNLSCTVTRSGGRSQRKMSNPYKGSNKVGLENKKSGKISETNNSNKKTILTNVSGKATSGELIAVMGPSGSGKSCLLDILAHRKTVGEMGGVITFSDVPVTATAIKAVSSYVTQEDVFHPTQTLLEAVLFQANMRLDVNISPEEKLARAEALILRAGLQGKEQQSVGGTLPGGIGVRGLSGGEKRRLSLVCATVAGPAILFADEVTSGLDSLAALMTVRLLKECCQELGMIVIATVHQPRQSVWACFSKVLVLCKGRQLFYGSTEAADEWFIQALEVPRLALARTSASDFIVDQINTDFDKEDLGLPKGHKTLRTLQDVEAMAAAFRASPLFTSSCPSSSSSTSASSGVWSDLEEETKMAVVVVGEEEGEGKYVHRMETLESLGHKKTKPSWFFQFRVLFQRNLRSYLRNKGNVAARLSIDVFVSVVAGLIFFQLGTHPPDQPHIVNDVLGSIYTDVFGAALLPFVSQSIFLHDRQFFSRENAAGLYASSAYYAVNVSLEMILNALGGFLFATISYYMKSYSAFVQPENEAACFLGYVGVLTLMTLMANAQVLFFTLLCPNQELGFLTAAGYITTANVAGGMVVAYPNVFPPIRWIQYISFIKYPCQAILLFWFKGNEKTRTPFGGTVEDLIHLLALDTPGTVGANVGACMAIYAVFIMGGFVCLKYLYKERR